MKFYVKWTKLCIFWSIFKYVKFFFFLLLDIDLLSLKLIQSWASIFENIVLFLLCPYCLAIPLQRLAKGLEWQAPILVPPGWGLPRTLLTSELSALSCHLASVILGFKINNSILLISQRLKQKLCWVVELVPCTISVSDLIFMSLKARKLSNISIY